MMTKHLLALAISSIIIAAVSFYKLSQQRKNNRKQNQIKEKKEKSDKNQYQNQATDRSNVADSQIEQDHQDRGLYDNDVTQSFPYKTILKKPKLNTYIDQLQYYILLNLNKSKGYEGVVKIKILSLKTPINNKDLYVDYLGSAIMYMSVNHKRIQEEEVIFQQHKILIKKQWLDPKQNNIQIIFANKYAFMGDGLTCYFPLDEFNKYSLKGQVIYVRNGFKKVSRIFPCLNVLNPCQVQLEVLHPNGFSTESNNHKMEMKIATKKDYPHYQFLFFANKSLNGSYRLNNSMMSESGSHRFSEEIVKALSRFIKIKLNTIHDFFVFCSAIVQVRPQMNLTSSTGSLNSSSKVFKDVLIRYFTKDYISKKASSFLGCLQSQIIQIFQKIDDYKSKNKIALLKYQCKIDIFFIDDLKAEGDFYSGSMLLNQKTVQRGIIDRRLYFLLCRAFIGMGMLMKKQESLLTLAGMMKLNELTIQIFNQCVDYIYVKNKQYENIRNQCVRIISNRQKNEQNNKIVLSQEDLNNNDMEYWLLQYYEKQCRYFVKNLDKFEWKVSANVKNVIKNLQNMNNQEYWAYFIARYPFIEFNVSEVLIKISLKYKGIPTNEAELKYAKDNFVKSKYYLKFFTFKQIQNDLKRFITLETHGLQKVLPYIKIKESFLPIIPKKLQTYLYAKQNKLESKNLYQQFKKYNESNNFHHITALRREIKRIKLLARDNIVEQRRNIQCGLLGWKLLQKLKLYPQDEDTYKLVTALEKIKLGDGKNMLVQQQQELLNAQMQLINERDRKREAKDKDNKEAEQEARKLQQLLQDSTDK